MLAQEADADQVVRLLGAGRRGAVVHEVTVAASHQMRSASGVQLSARELQVMALVARGCTNVQVGQHLNVSPMTVKSHLARVRSRLKIGTGDRAGMVAALMREGILT